MRKKVLVVANLVGFVGFLWKDIEILQRMGYEVHYAANASLFPSTEAIEKLHSRNIPFFDIMFDSKKPINKNNIIGYRQIKKILKKYKYDVIHCHTPIAGAVVRLAAASYRKKGTKVLYTTHGFTFTHLSSKKEWLGYFNFEKFLSRFTDAIITINKEDYNNAKKMHCKNVFYINGVGVDTAQYINVKIDREQYRESLGVKKDEIMILAVGELSSRKNHEIIVRALSLLPDKEKYVFMVCGKGVSISNVENTLLKLADEFKVKVRLLGFRYDIPEITTCSDIGAIPSVREGLGFAGIQSLCAGVPLVASDVQGIKDYVFDDIDGYLCNPFSAEEFANAIRRLSSKSARDCMVEKCIQIAKQFDISISKRQMEKVYSSILNEGL